MSTKLTYKQGRPDFSTLTRRYYPTYDTAFQDSLRAVAELVSTSISTLSTQTELQRSSSNGVRHAGSRRQ
jgi:hypothetical protein